jgi:beta-glucosidase
VQADYLRLLKDNGARLVLVLTGGSALALGDVADLADAILYIWYPGQEGGRALADVLFGHVAPSGKLPLTFPRSIDQLPPFEEYDMMGRTYRYMAEDPQFPFGFGLSYTQFVYEGVQAPAKIMPGDTLPVQVTVRNSGTVDADEVVQLYLSAAAHAAGDPLFTLVGFSRVQLSAGETQTVEFTLTGEELGTVDEDGRLAMRPGAYRLTAGGSSPGAVSEALGATKPQVWNFVIE